MAMFVHLTAEKNVNRILAAVLSAILSAVLLCATSPAQSFLFVSPNTRDHLSDEAAADALHSLGQNNFLAVARYLAGKICRTPQVLSAEGIYQGNAENSSLITGCANSRAQYLGELLGLYSHQKWVLVFDPSAAGGNERLIMVEFPGNHPAEAVKLLRQYNIGGATLFFRDQKMAVYVWAVDHSQDSAIHALAAAGHGSFREIQGKGTMIGNDDRSAAQQAFDRRIHRYERAHHWNFSRLLESKQFHEMVSSPAGEAQR